MTRRKYLDKCKESRILAHRLFHEHLDKCEQCREHPFEFCPEGHKALCVSMGLPPPSPMQIQIVGSVMEAMLNLKSQTNESKA